MQYEEITIYTSQSGLEVLTGRLLDIGIEGIIVEDPQEVRAMLEGLSGQSGLVDEALLEPGDERPRIKLYLPDNAQGFNQLALIKDMLCTLRSDDTLGSLELALSHVKDEDWAEQWKKYFVPIEFDKLVIKPTWENYDNRDNRLILNIDPGMSFGTGSHESTKLCLSLLEQCVTPGMTVLDVGCGSGILSVAALLLGAERVTALDILEDAVKTAQENALLNNVADRLDARLCNILETPEQMGTGYNLIVANIVADVLIMMGKLLTGALAPGGTLIMSGIIDTREKDITDYFCALTGSNVTVFPDKGWVAVKLNVRG